ncbi:hypothetical protein [Burkholderia stabilis]
MKVNIQFSDSTQTKIISYFAGPQDETVYPNQAVIDTDDVRWKEFYDSLPAISQRGLPPPTSSQP